VVEPGDALVVCPRLRIYAEVSTSITVTHVVAELDKRNGWMNNNVYIPPVGSALGNKSWPQMLHAATPVTSAAKAKKGPLESSAIDCLYDQYTHNVYQVPGPEVTYTLASRAIERSRHG
jgi:hypothetical protein